MSLISDSEKAKIKSVYKEFFDAFKEDITVHRRGKLKTVDVNLSQVFGYEEHETALSEHGYSDTPNFSYVLTNSVFKGLVIYPSNTGQKNTSDFDYVEEVKANLSEGEVVIKVEENCKKYLIDAPVERVDIGAKSYKLASKDVQVNRILTEYYFFKLKESE